MTNLKKLEFCISFVIFLLVPKIGWTQLLSTSLLLPSCTLSLSQSQVLPGGSFTATMQTKNAVSALVQFNGVNYTAKLSSTSTATFNLKAGSTVGSFPIYGYAYNSSGRASPACSSTLKVALLSLNPPLTSTVNIPICQAKTKFYPSILGSGYPISTGIPPSPINRYRTVAFTPGGDDAAFVFTNRISVKFESLDGSISETVDLFANQDGWLVEKDDQGNLPEVPFQHVSQYNWNIPSNSNIRMAMEPVAGWSPYERQFIFDKDYLVSRGLQKATFQTCYIGSCKESGDIGKDPFRKGNVNFENGKIVVEDRCSGNTDEDTIKEEDTIYSVVEYSCDPQTLGYAADFFVCPNGCINDGACKP